MLERTVTTESNNKNPGELDELKKLDDLHLLSRYHECGCQASFGIICDRHHAALDNFLRKFLGGLKSHAPDIVQETFFRLHTHTSQDRPIPHVRHWLFSVAANLAINLKKSGYHRRVEPQSWRSGRWDLHVAQVGGEGVPESAANRELLSKIWSLAEDLDPPVAEAMRLVYKQGLTHTEAAEIMDVPRTTVSTWIQRCLAEVQRHFPETRRNVA